MRGHNGKLIMNEVEEENEEEKKAHSHPSIQSMQCHTHTFIYAQSNELITRFEQHVLFYLIGTKKL